MLALNEETVTLETVLEKGTGQCSGYMPWEVDGETSKRYMEIWKYEKYVYMVIDVSNPTKEVLSKWDLIPLGPDWTAER